MQQLRKLNWLPESKSEAAQYVRGDCVRNPIQHLKRVVRHS